MNNIFSKGKGKILEVFYQNKNNELYFSEILRETKLTPNTTLKHLKNLQKNNLIISIKKRANTFYQINPKNPQIYSILSYFDYKKFNQLPSERKIAINQFLKKLKIKPLIILIFGSTAKGTFNKKSDIDIVIIYNKKEYKDLKLINEVESITGTKIQLFTFDYNYFKEQYLKKEDNLLIHAIKTGFILSGHYLFYKEILKNEI